MTTLARSTLCLAALAIAGPVAAQVRDFNAASDSYGRGVHAYFAGDTAKAEELLSLALTQNANDPRINYFRAMNRLRLGRTEEAKSDMMAGAELEARHRNRYAVGTALARVQGSDRLLLERFRQQARARAMANGRPSLDQQSDTEAGMLRSQVVIPLDELLRPGGPQPLSAQEISRRRAAINAQSVDTAAAPLLPAGVASPEDDPFRNETAAAPPEAEAPESPPAEPVETPPAEAAPAETPPADVPPADESTETDDDPFGGLQ